jgi:hypothetical protein
LADFIKKKDLTICSLQETDCIDGIKQGGLQTYLVRRNKEGHFKLIKGAIHQEEITNINLYALHVGAPNYIKYTLKELKNLTYTPSQWYREILILLNHQQICCTDIKINKVILELIDTID